MRHAGWRGLDLAGGHRYGNFKGGLQPILNRWLLVVVALLTTACASLETPPLVQAPSRPAAVAGFDFTSDTFAFPNEIRARNPDRDDLYANYCFVLARGLRQFFLFARFDPGAPSLTAAEYTERVRAVAARSPWEPPAPPADRIVIPGYASLREFSRGEETSVKAGLGGRFWTLVKAGPVAGVRGLRRREREGFASRVPR